MHTVCIATKPFLAKTKDSDPLVAGMKDRFGWKKFGQPVEVGSFSRNLRAFLHPKCCKISSINRNSLQVDLFHPNPVVYTYSHAWGLGSLKIRLPDPLRLKGSPIETKPTIFVWGQWAPCSLLNNMTSSKINDKSFWHWGVPSDPSGPVDWETPLKLLGSSFLLMLLVNLWTVSLCPFICFLGISMTQISKSQDFSARNFQQVSDGWIISHNHLGRLNQHQGSWSLRFMNLWH